MTSRLDMGRGFAGSALAWLMLSRQLGAMKDLLFTLITIGFFVAAWYYAKACERL